MKNILGFFAKLTLWNKGNEKNKKKE